jgi:KaiC/GvpD/RAD55 family RecA-like ATPase
VKTDTVNQSETNGKRTSTYEQEADTSPHNGEFVFLSSGTGEDKKNGGDVLDALVRVWKQPEPKEMAFIVEDVLPEGFPSLLFAHSGTGKSYLALHLGISVCLGRDFLGMKCLKRRVLYLDTELDQHELIRRAHHVARGMGLSDPPDGLFYYRAKLPLGHKALVSRVRKYIDENEIGLVIVDSLSIGASASDVSNQQEAVALMKSLEEWGTVLCIDHISKAAAAGDPRRATAFGSTFKRGFARSAMVMFSGDDGIRTIAHDKSNFGPLRRDVHFEVIFKDGPRRKVRFQLVKQGDSRLREAPSKRNPVERLVTAVEELYSVHGRPMTHEELAANLNLAESTVANYVSKAKGRVRTFGNKTCAPIITHDSKSNVSE